VSASAERRIELARDGIVAYDSGDVEAALKLLSPDIEVYSPPGTVNVGTYHGIEGFLEWTTMWNEAWERFEREVLRVEAVGERHAVAVVHQTGVGRESGVEVEQVSGYLMELNDDEQCSYFALYNDLDAAFAAAREREGSA
jgi:ketosteroid isomerase-like protein